MSNSIDERVVSMKFKSDGFQKGAADTKRAIEQLKLGMNFDKAKAGLASFAAESGKFNLNGMQGAIEGLSSRFEALRVAGVAALATLASQAVMYGQRLVQGLLDPIKQGLEEYETNLNSVQTILANTQSSGAGLKEVNSALDELNTYSDQTIYNFSEMARNIGTFTAAGVNLDASTSAIKGIANLAALSGSNSEQASSAMYQLSQALASGKVGLQDWNSVVNAGMGGTVFQRALAQTAVKMGTLSESAVSLTGDMKNVKISGESFRDSISASGGKASWLTSDVLTKTLAQFTGDMTDAQLAAEGFSAAQIKQIQQQAQTAKSAATEVKTFTQLMGTLAEAQGSGWAKSFQLIFGDFEQAKSLWTSVSNELGTMIGASADARNKILADWQASGGRDAAIQTVSNLWKALLGIINPIREAFRDIFPPLQGKTLADMTKSLAEFTKGLIIGGPAAENLKSTFRGFFAVLDIGWSILKGVLSVIGSVFSAFGSGGDDASGGILNLTGSIGDFLVSLRDFLKEGNLITRFFETLGAVVAAPVKGIVFLAGVIGEFFKSLFTFDLAGLGDVFGRIGDRLASLGAIGGILGAAGKAVGDFFKMVGKWMQPGLEAVGDFGKQLGQVLQDSIESGDFSAVLDLINTGFIGGIFLLFRGFFKNLKGLFGGGGGGGLMESITGIFDGVTDTLSAMQSQLKAKTLLTIAAAVGILALSVIALSLVDSARLTAALVAITVMFGQMAGTLALFSKVAGMGGIAKIPILAAALILLGGAVLVLAAAVSILAKLNWDELARGLTGVVVVIGALVGAAALLKSQGPGMIVAAGSMVILAAAVKVLASATKDFASLSWEEIARGLTGVGSVLAAVIVFNKLSSANKGAAISAVNILLLASALKLFASSVKDFSAFDMGSLAQGLLGVGVILGMLVAFTKTAGNPAGIIKTGAALVILGAAMKIMASAVKDFSSMDWNELARGVVGMAGALAIIVVAMAVMPPNMLMTAAALVVVGAALKIIASAFSDMGGMSWDEIGRGFVVLAGSLVLLAAAMYAMTGALPGAAAMIVAAGAIAILAPAIVLLGQMSWGEIGAGIGALGIALGILAVAGVALLPAIPGLLGLGAAIALIGFGVGIAAAGIGLFSLGLVALGTAGPLAATGLTAMVTAILNLLPLAMQKLGEGIAAFADVIGNSGPQLVSAFTALILSLLGAINRVAPQILSTMVNLINGLLSTIVRNLPQFIAKGSAIIVGFLNGIAAKMGAVVTAATNLIVALVRGIGNNIGRVVSAATDVITKFIRAVSDNAVKLADEGGKAVVNFVRGVASSIRSNSEQLRSAGKDLGLAIVDGMTGGLGSKVGSLVDKAKSIAGSAISAAKGALGIKSPSREFKKIGAWSTEGWAIGTANGESDVVRATTSVGDSAITAMKSAMSSISDTVNDNMDTSPTIRPVLDLDGVRKEAAKVGGLMGVPSIKAKTSYASAASAESGYSTNRDAAQAAQAPTTTSYHKEVKLEQNLYSPKALPAGEIYRTTRNTLSQLEEELSTP